MPKRADIFPMPKRLQPTIASSKFFNLQTWCNFRCLCLQHRTGHRNVLSSAFYENSSIILLTSSFSAFLIFRFLFCEQLVSTAFIMECSFFLMFLIVVFDTPYCSASLRWLHSRTSLFCCKLSSVCNFRLAILSLMQVSYNTVCTIENNVCLTVHWQTGLFIT